MYPDAPVTSTSPIDGSGVVGRSLQKRLGSSQAPSRNGRDRPASSLGPKIPSLETDYGRDIDDRPQFYLPQKTRARIRRSQAVVPPGQGVLICLKTYDKIEARCMLNILKEIARSCA